MNQRTKLLPGLCPQRKKAFTWLRLKDGKKSPLRIDEKFYKRLLRLVSENKKSSVSIAVPTGETTENQDEMIFWRSLSIIPPKYEIFK